MCALHETAFQSTRETYNWISFRATNVHVYLYMYAPTHVGAFKLLYTCTCTCSINWATQCTCTYHFFSGMGRGTVLILQGLSGWPEILRPRIVPTRFRGRITNRQMQATATWERNQCIPLVNCRYFRSGGYKQHVHVVPNNMLLRSHCNSCRLIMMYFNPSVLALKAGHQVLYM